MPPDRFITHRIEGTRQSGRTEKLIQYLEINAEANPDASHLVVCHSAAAAKSFEQRISELLKSFKIDVVGSPNSARARGIQVSYLYIDNIPESGDHWDECTIGLLPGGEIYYTQLINEVEPEWLGMLRPGWVKPRTMFEQLGDLYKNERV